MKNSELLATTKDDQVYAIDRQRRFILRTLIEKKSCPNCGAKLNYFEATGIGVDDLDLIKGHAADHVGKCPTCKRTLEHTIPMLGGWYWHLVPVTVE